MLNKSLGRRLENLESQFRPEEGGEALVIRIVYTTPEGDLSDGPSFTIPNPGTAGWGRKRRP
jgi:hypothetical protein